MNDIKLKRIFKLVIPRFFEQDEIIEELEKVLDKRVCFNMGLLDSFSVMVKNNDGSIEDFLRINIKIKDGIAVTIVSQEIEGKRFGLNDVYEKEPTVMESICNGIEGLFLINEYETDSYSKETKSYYAINYDENSIDYKIISSLIDNVNDSVDCVVLAQIIKNKKEELLEALK